MAGAGFFGAPPGARAACRRGLWVVGVLLLAVALVTRLLQGLGVGSTLPGQAAADPGVDAAGAGTPAKLGWFFALPPAARGAGPGAGGEPGPTAPRSKGHRARVLQRLNAQ